LGERTSASGLPAGITPIGTNSSEIPRYARGGLISGPTNTQPRPSLTAAGTTFSPDAHPPHHHPIVSSSGRHAVPLMRLLFVKEGDCDALAAPRTPRPGGAQVDPAAG
jgi:hypothetical protein